MTAVTIQELSQSQYNSIPEQKASFPSILKNGTS